MEVVVNPNGTRNRDYRPYIDQEESARSLTLYNPEQPYHYRLYDGAQPPCQSFQSDFWGYKARFGTLPEVPSYRARTGVMPSGRYIRVSRHPFEPSIW